MDWTVAASFFREEKPQWLTQFVPGDRHHFRYIPQRDRATSVSWHNRTSVGTTYKEWLAFWQQSGEAIQNTQGVITVLPRLATTVGIRQRLARRRIPVVAWWFNIGEGFSPGWQTWLSRASLESVDRFVVHNRCEQKFYSQWLNLPIDRFVFAPRQRAEIPITEQEDNEQPFIFTTGSAYRDFPTLFEAVKKLNYPTIVVSGPRALQGLTLPPQVKSLNVPKAEIWRLAQRARINVVPMTTQGITAGIVTIVEAMRMGCSIVATRRSGVDDYLEDGKTSLLVSPGSVDELADALDRLWNDPALRQQLSSAAYDYGVKYLSDEAAGVNLGQILDEVADEYGY